MSRIAWLLVGAVVARIGGIAAADGWTVINLHPTGVSDSTRALATGGGPWAVGWVGNNGHSAVRWDGSANGYQNVHPPSTVGSEILATDGSHSVGWAAVTGIVQALVWTTDWPNWSWTSLHPANAVDSKAMGCGGGQQVGYVSLWSAPGVRKASLWSGTAGSWVNISAGSSHSQAVGTNGVKQVGWTSSFNLSNPRAALWYGTAQSYVDLHPAGTQVSQCLGIAPSGDQQVGFTGVNPSSPRACMWNDTADSWAELHPAGATTSQAVATIGSWQVGWSTVHGIQGACVWNGSAETWVDLHAELPAGYELSQATGVSVLAGAMYVSGFARRMSPLRDEAKLWVMRLPVSADINSDGIVNGADLGLLLGDWGNCASCESDLNADGVVDGADLGVLLADWTH